MSVEDIRREEERCRLEQVAEKRASRKRKHQALISDATTSANDADNSVVTMIGSKKSGQIDSKSSDDGECIDAPVQILFVGANEQVPSDVQPGTFVANNHTETIAHLKERITVLKKELFRTQQKVHHWKTKYIESIAVNKKSEARGEGPHVVQCASTAIEELMQSEHRYMRASGRRSEKARKEYRNALVLSIWTNTSTFYENLRPMLIAHMKRHLRETVFHPARILMQMDLADGTLSMEGLEVLRMCETNGERYVRNTIICSSADIKHCCQKVDRLAKSIVPYEHGHLDDANGGGEFIQWNPMHMLAAMISSYQLTEVAKERPIEVHVAIDGAMISKNWNHLTAGVKQGDNAALCPRKKHLIYGNVDETTIQSRDHCFPYIMAMCRETKKSIEWMRPRLEQLEAIGRDGARWWGNYKPLNSYIIQTCR